MRFEIKARAHGAFFVTGYIQEVVAFEMDVRPRKGGGSTCTTGGYLIQASRILNGWSRGGSTPMSPEEIVESLKEEFADAVITTGAE